MFNIECNKVILIMIAILFISCNKNRNHIDIAFAINSLSGCDANYNDCPDTIFLPQRYSDVNNFDKALFEECFDEFNTLDFEDDFPLETVPQVQINNIKGKNLFYYNNAQWKPPKYASMDNAYISYSKAFSNDSIAILYLTKHLSGKNIKVSICKYKILRNEFVFDSCYCHRNPF